MKWGITYLSQCSAGRIVKVICREATSAGYAITSRTDSDGVVSIQMVQTRSRLKTLWRRLPQDVYWRIWDDNGHSRVYCDSKLSMWYLGMVLLSCGLFALMFWIGVNTFTGEWTNTPVASLYIAGGLLFSSLILVFVNYALILAGGIERLAFVTGAIRQEARQLGTFFEATGTGISPRHVVRTILYLAFFILVVLFRFWNEICSFKFKYLLTIEGGMLAFLVACILVLIVFLPMMLCFKGFSLRLVPGLAGVTTAISVLFILCAQIPWTLYNGKLTQEDVRAVIKARNYICVDKVIDQSIQVNGRQISRTEVQQKYRQIQFIVWISIAGTILLIGIGFAFLYGAIDCALKGWPYMDELAANPDLVSSKGAMTVAGLLPLFRTVWVVFWLLLATCIFWGMYILSKTTVYAFQDLSQDGLAVSLNTIEASIFFISIATGVSPESAALSLTIRSCWILYVMGCWILFATSMGSAFVQRYITIRRSRIPFTVKEDSAERLSDRLSALCQRLQFSCCKPELIITENQFPFARSRRLGILGRRNTIEVTTRCLEILNDKELDALLAHELAHHIRRHCLIDDILRFFGRLTFFGDGFVRVLEDSFGYELEADRFAIAELRTNPTDLKKCLWKVRNIGATETLRHFSMGTSMAAAHSASRHGLIIPKGLDSLSLLQRLRLAILLYVRQYLGLKHSGYWHPSTDIRIKMIDMLCKGVPRSVSKVGLT